MSCDARLQRSGRFDRAGGGAAAVSGNNDDADFISTASAAASLPKARIGLTLLDHPNGCLVQGVSDGAGAQRASLFIFLLSHPPAAFSNHSHLSHLQSSSAAFSSPATSSCASTARPPTPTRQSLRRATPVGPPDEFFNCHLALLLKLTVQVRRTGCRSFLRESRWKQPFTSKWLLMCRPMGRLQTAPMMTTTMQTSAAWLQVTYTLNSMEHVQ